MNVESLLCTPEAVHTSVCQLFFSKKIAWVQPSLPVFPPPEACVAAASEVGMGLLLLLPPHVLQGFCGSGRDYCVTLAFTGTGEAGVHGCGLAIGRVCMPVPFSLTVETHPSLVPVLFLHCGNMGMAMSFLSVFLASWEAHTRVPPPAVGCGPPTASCSGALASSAGTRSPLQCPHASA